jgi:hypothetical protein
MTRKLPADIPSPELRGATRPDQPKWRKISTMPQNKIVRLTDSAKRFQWSGMVIGDNPPLPLYHNGAEEIEPAHWADMAQ